jgi:exonuclease SbcC
MIPVRLVLKDFLSYASPPPLDFTTFQVACLSGSNGVGKSALLDAITWSAWGCARGCEGGMNQERLIRDGADETSVEFTFELGTATYRIVRKRPRKGKPELQFLVQDGDTWKNIAGESLKETDAKIASVLRMDYKTFTASAFFLQGRSEDFLTRLSPDERKDVFARLLDLGVYEKLEDAARDRARDAERERKELEGRVEDMTASLPDIAALEAELAELSDAMQGIDERSAIAAVELQASRDVLSGFQATAATLDAEREAFALTEKALEEVAAQHAQHSEHLRQIDELLARSEEVERAISETEKLVKEETEARDRQQRAAALEAQRAELTAVIDGQRRTIEDRLTDLRKRIAAIGTEISTLEKARDDVAKLDETLIAAGDVTVDLEEGRALFESLTADGARLNEQIAQLDAATEKANRALAVLADGGGECPVCGTALDAKHRAKVKKDITKEIKDNGAARDKTSADLEVARKEAVRCREENRRLSKAIEERDEILKTREGLLGRLERLDVATVERTALVEALAIDEALVADASFAAKEQEALATLTKELEGLYDADAHTKLRARITDLAPYAALAGRLEEAARSRERLVTDIETAASRTAEMTRVASERSVAIDTLQTQLEGLPDAEKAAAEADEKLRSLVRLAADAAAEQGRLQERVANTRKAADELEQAKKQERDAADTHRRYRRLVEAFGPAGIPKLIIDNALPELTEDANRILGRLSDHEMSIQFHLDRQTKTGKAKETFEVRVHHDGGVRDFAMFSGGEAFRVAFAVRLAMSKLLVRRSGARLETLVIDEGFGTQDPEGRERLVEAINLARGEFAKVIVITHLDDLKDQFGAQIRVEKGIAGSSLELVGN